MLHFVEVKRASFFLGDESKARRETVDQAEKMRVVPIVLLFGCCFVLCSSRVEQVHLAQGGVDSSTMTVMWITPELDRASECYFSEEKFHDTPPSTSSYSGDGIKVATGSSGSYTFGAYESGLIHTVKLEGLSASTKYYYRCGDAKHDLSEADVHFITLPAPGDERSLTYALVGDLGTTPFSKSTLRHMARNNRIQAVLHAGDLSYANCEQPIWDYYGRMIEPLARRVPWMVSVGNHEIEQAQGEDGKTLFKAVEARYHMPEVKPAEFGAISLAGSGCTPSTFTTNYDYGISYFSYKSGSAHIIHLNCYAETSPDSKQFSWLAEDLEAVDRSQTPWVFVVEHCPWYNSNEAHHDETQTVAMRENMEDLLYKHNVNLVFAGHVHAYERSYPTYKGVVDPKGITYINIGDGGNKEGHAKDYEQVQPDWSSFRNGTWFGHGLVEVINSTVLEWKWMRNVDHDAVAADHVIVCNSILTDNVAC